MGLVEPVPYGLKVEFTKNESPHTCPLSVSLHFTASENYFGTLDGLHCNIRTEPSLNPPESQTHPVHLSEFGSVISNWLASVGLVIKFC